MSDTGAKWLKQGLSIRVGAISDIVLRVFSPERKRSSAEKCSKDFRFFAF